MLSVIVYVKIHVAVISVLLKGEVSKFQDIDYFGRIEIFRNRKISIFRCENCIIHLNISLGAKFYYLSACIVDFTGV